MGGRLLWGVILSAPLRVSGTCVHQKETTAPRNLGLE